MNCCDEFGKCQRGIGCPAGPAGVAKVGKQTPRNEFVDTDNMLTDAFVSSMYDEQDALDAMSTVRMLAYALVALALTGAAVTLAVAITIF